MFLCVTISHKIKKDIERYKVIIMRTAKELGYTIIDEFDSDISTITTIKNIDGKIAVIDEFDIDITRRVKIFKNK